MFLPYKEVQRVNDGEFVEYILLRVYIINVLRIGIGGGIIGAIYYIVVSKKSKYSGDKDNIDETLKALFINAKQKLISFPVQLF